MANRYRHHPVSAHPCLYRAGTSSPFCSFLHSFPKQGYRPRKTHFIFVYSEVTAGKRQSRAKAVNPGRWTGFCRSHLDVSELLLNQEADLIPVIPWVIEAAAGWFPISPSSARLLVIPSHWLCNIPVGNKSVYDKTTGNIRLQVSQITAYMIVLFMNINKKTSKTSKKNKAANA